MRGSKVIQDPVHGSIVVDGVFLEMLDRHEMQRLRSVKQLGLGNLVFPGANHTRFEHCLGTYHLAGRMAEVIGLSREDSDAVRMAGMLHDVCHPPFSHTLEPAMEDATGLDHTELARALIMGIVPNHLPGSEDILGGLPTMAETMESAGISAEAVCDIIASPESMGEEALDRFWNKHECFPSKYYAHQIIHGPVDADQMDYLMRDAHYTGVSYGSIDSERLIKTMMVMNDRIVLRRRGITAAEGLMVSRSLMYTSVYFHETVRIAQRMLTKAVEGSDLDLSDIYLRGDSDIMSMVAATGGRPSRNIRRIQARMLDKKAFAVYSEDMTDEKAEVLLRYAGREGARRLEREVADAAGVDVFDVGVEVTSSSNLQGKMRIDKTNVVIADDGGRVKSLTRFSPIARSLQVRDPYGWAVLIFAPEGEREAVRRAAERVLGLRRSTLYHADGCELRHRCGEACVADHADDLVDVLVCLGGLLEYPLHGSVPEVDPFFGHLPHDAVHGKRVDGRFPGHISSGPVAGRPEGLLHGASSACEYVGPDAHVTRDYDRLAHVAVFQRDFGSPGREGAGGALPVHEDVLVVAVNVVALLLGNVVGHVVDYIHPHVFGGPA